MRSLTKLYNYRAFILADDLLVRAKKRREGEILPEDFQQKSLYNGKEYYCYAITGDTNHSNEKEYRERITKLFLISRSKSQALLHCKDEDNSIKNVCEKVLKDNLKFKVVISKEFEIKTHTENYIEKFKGVFSCMTKKEKLYFKNWINSRII